MALKAEILAELEELSEGQDDDLLKDLVDLFESNVGSLTISMRKSLERKDSKEFERAAHTLKGSAAGLGLEQTAEICFRLEQRGRKSEFAGCQEVIQSIEGELRNNIILLREYLKNRKSR